MRHGADLARLGRALARGERLRLTVEGFRPAAVLVPLLLAPDGLRLLFTVRSASLRNHAGQIAFPGGRVDAGETIEDAARRETLEEVGLDVPAGAVLGRLDDLPSPARYVATPVVAALPWPQPLALNPAEVAEAFTVPLAELASLTPHSEVRELREMRRRIHFYTWTGGAGADAPERLIWGFTGNVLKNLLDLYGSDGPDGPPD